MPHRTWISLIGWFIDHLISWLISRLIGWLTGVSGADGRSGEVDGPSDRSTDRSWFSGVGGLNDDWSTRGPSDSSIAGSSGGLTEGLTDGSTEGLTEGSNGGLSDDPSGGPSRCSKFSVVGACYEFSVVGDGCLPVDWFSDGGDDCLPVDWFSDVGDEEVDCLNDCSFGCPPDCPPRWPSDWPPGCSSSWFCGGGWVERGGMGDGVGGRLYGGMGGNRLYNCLLNTDENSGGWKNFEKRDWIDDIDGIRGSVDFGGSDCLDSVDFLGSVDCMQDSIECDDPDWDDAKRRCACHE